MEFLPDWLKRGSRACSPRDAVAGVTLAAFILPSALADASLANLPPEAGLYACLFSGLVFWLFCSSRQTAVTVTSGLSILVGASIGELAGGDVSKYAAFAACTAILTGVLALLAWVLKAGVVVNFISETVLTGFKFGIAFVLVSTQLPKFCGFSGSHGDFWERIGHFLAHLDSINPAAAVVGLCAIVLLSLGRKYCSKLPVPLLVLILGIVAASALDLNALYGIKMLGEIPQGLPAVGVPHLSRHELNDILPLAMACFLLGSVESAAIGRMFAAKHGYRFNPNKEFLGLAAANIASGLGQGFPVSGGMTQSLVNESAGAKTPLSGFVASLVILLVAVYFTGLLRDLPQPVLAAIVLMAAGGLMKFQSMKQLWRFSRSEFTVAAAAMAGVLSSGILRGVLIGAVLSLILLLRRSSRPRTVELGRVPGVDYYADLVRHPENTSDSDVFVFRCEGALLYFNAEYVRDRFDELLAARGSGVRLAVFYLGMVPGIDLAGVEMLAELRHALAKKGIALRVAETHGQLREALRRGGFEAEYGPLSANQTVAAAIAEWRAAEPAAA